MNGRTYRIGGIVFNILFPPQLQLKREVSFIDFEDKSTHGIDLVCGLVEKDFVEDGYILYRENTTVILKKDGRMFRYTGVLETDRKVFWGSCTEIEKGEQKVFYVSFSKGRGICPTKVISEKQVFSAVGFAYIMTRSRRVILHASLISYGNKGIAFTAPSGTGKSTQADLWRRWRSDVQIINGDRAVLSCNDGQAIAHGLPFCGSSGIARNISVPLKAIIILRKGKENRIKSPGATQAIKCLLSECAIDIWDREGTELVIEVMTDILRKVQVFIYECLPDRSAVDFLANFLQKNGI